MKEIEAWVARDKDGGLYLYLSYRKPRKVTEQWHASDYIRLADEMFPEVKWSDDEPTKVKLVIDK